jgi:hypothetical protein
MIKIETKGSFKTYIYIQHCITNLLGFIGLYKFCVKFGFHRFVPKSYEFHVIVDIDDIDDIFMYSIY